MIFYQNSNAVCSKVNKVRRQFLSSTRIEYDMKDTLNIAYLKGFYGCSFPEAKASGKLAFGQLPILDIDGEHQIAQSGAQNRYVASLVKKPGFNPSAPAKVAFCDMIHETHQGVFYLHLLEFTFVCQFYFEITNLA